MTMYSFSSDSLTSIKFTILGWLIFFKINNSLSIYFLASVSLTDALSITFVANCLESPFLDVKYISPNEDYRVTIYEDWEYSDRVIIYVSDIPEPIITYDEFPSEVLASLLGEDITDAIPALTGADSYTITCVTSTDGTDIYGEVQCTFRDYDNTDIEEIVNNYNNVTLAGWETYYDGDGDPTDYKKSPNNQIAVRAEYDDYEEYYVVTIYFDNIVDGLI